MPWDPITQPVDYVLLAGQRSPGIATVEGASSPRAWDQRRGYGLSGATVVFRGLRLAQFKVFVRLCTEADWQAWEAWRPLVARPPFPELAAFSGEARADLQEAEVAIGQDPTQANDPVTQQQLRTLRRRADAEEQAERRAGLGRRAPRALDIWHPHLEALGIRSCVVEDLLQPVQDERGEWTIEIRFLEYRRPRVALARPQGSQQRTTDPVDRYIEQHSTPVQELAGS